MLHLYTILMVAVVILADRGYALSGWDSGVRGWGSVIMACVPPAVMIGAYAFIVIGLKHRLKRTGRRSVLFTAERALAVVQWCALINHCLAVLVFGWLATIQSWLGGNIILVDIALALAPPLGVLAIGWWLYEPLLRHVREHAIIRRLDSGEPVYAIPRRGVFVIQQLRTHVLLLLVPLLCIALISETVDAFLPYDNQRGFSAWNQGLTFVGALIVFALAPQMARFLLHVSPLPEGEVRTALLDVCRSHRVRVREILLWKTDGSMLNGAVMGLIGPLRYVLLTDALLESMRRDQVIAVMAHEIGHVRRKHMVWLVLTLVATVGLPNALFDLAVVQTYNAQPQWLFALHDSVGGAEAFAGWVEGAAIALTLLIAFIAFGWICRRFERQADTFAVQHMSGLVTARDRPHPETDPTSKADADESDRTAEPAATGRVTAEAVTAMQTALQTIVRMNAINPRKRSWRHGSIRWRQEYLFSIIGKPIDALRIDRLIGRIKVATAIALALIAAYAFSPLSRYDSSSAPDANDTLPPMAVEPTVAPVVPAEDELS